VPPLIAAQRMNVIPAAIPEVLIIAPKLIGDERGFFVETFRVAWGVSAPMLSARDAAAPLSAEVAALPTYGRT
jgi:hypothetical protein